MLVLAAMSNEILHGAIAYKLYIYHINLKPKKKKSIKLRKISFEENLKTRINKKLYVL